MNELHLIGVIILIIIAIMFLSYFLITITNPNYPSKYVDIIQIYITQFNNDAQLLFTNVGDLLNYTPSGTTTAANYFIGINTYTSQMILTINNQSSIFKAIDLYLAAVESLISAYIKYDPNNVQLNNVIGAYNTFMIVILGYDIQNETTADLYGIYNIEGAGLITPFGKLRRKVINSDPNAYIMLNAFNNTYGCFIFTT